MNVLEEGIGNGPIDDKPGSHLLDFVRDASYFPNLIFPPLGIPDMISPKQKYKDLVRVGVFFQVGEDFNQLSLGQLSLTLLCLVDDCGKLYPLWDNSLQLTMFEKVGGSPKNQFERGNQNGFRGSSNNLSFSLECGCAVLYWGYLGLRGLGLDCSCLSGYSIGDSALYIV